MNRLSKLLAAPAADPDRVALIDGHRSWSRAELAAEADALLSAIRRPPDGGGTDRSGGPEDGSPGERPVAVVLPPTALGVIAIHAVLRSGRLLAPLNPRLTAPELAEALSAVGPSVVLTDRAGKSDLDRALEGTGAWVDGLVLARSSDRSVPTVRLVDRFRGGRPSPSGGTSGPGRDERSGRSRPSGAAVLWTSGTSGRPRGVVLSGAGLLHSALASRDRLALVPGDRWYASLSPAHVGGLALITRAALLGSTLVVRGDFRAEELWGLVRDGEVTHASLVPTMLRRLLEAADGRPAPPTLRCLLVGGAGCPLPLLERAVGAGFPVALTYGLTEATSQVATAPPDLVRRKPGTVGAPLDGVEVKVAPDGSIRVRGPTVATGLLGGGRLPVDGEGWLETGDLGELDEDGHLHVTGRRSERIVTGGVNVDPLEVEDALVSHPAVRAAAVVGLPDETWGERVSAVVVRHEKRREPDADTLVSWLRGRLTGAKVPKEISFAETLPQNANGKVDRAAVRRALETRGPGSVDRGRG